MKVINKKCIQSYILSNDISGTSSLKCVFNTKAICFSTVFWLQRIHESFLHSAFFLFVLEAHINLIRCFPRKNNFSTRKTIMKLWLSEGQKMICVFKNFRRIEFFVFVRLTEFWRIQTNFSRTTKYYFGNRVQKDRTMKKIFWQL